MVLDGSETTERLGKLVAVLDGEITSVNSSVDVRIIYYVLNKDSSVNPCEIWSEAALLNKGIKPKEGNTVKIGIYSTKHGSPSVRVLNENEFSDFQEPQTKIEKLEQKIWVYRALTHGRYVPYL